MKVLLTSLYVCLILYKTSATNSCCPAGNGVDCHPTSGASQSVCIAKGCVWCALPPGVLGPWCQYPKSVAAGVRVDCHPNENATPDNCRNRGCIWCEPGDQNKAQPYCIFDASNPATIAGYNARNLNQFSNGFSANLNRRNGPIISGSPVVYNLNLQIKYESSSIIHVTISQNTQAEGLETESTDTAYLFAVQVQQQPFGIAVTRSSNGKVIFDTRNIPGPIIEDQYIAINTLTPTANIYGFGEQTHPNLRHDGNYNKLPMFSRDHPVLGYNYNLYGTHPFYIVVEDDGSTHGVHFINSHAQRAISKPNPAIQYEAIGGNLEFRVFLGPTPAQVVQQYLSTIGTPILPPYWSLGFHLCRYGYTGLDNVKTVHDRMVKSGIPYDTQWVDIDYMDGFRVWTYDHNKWSGLPQFVQQLHNEKRQFVTIVDPCIKSRDPNYQPLKEGIQQNVFLKTPASQNYEGSVWPGCCYFPDFTCQQTKDWWKTWIVNWNQTMAVDGLWIDMNEPSNAFCPKPAPSLPQCDYCKICSQNKWNNPPVALLPDKDINTATVCMDTKTCTNNLQYSEHTKYGHYEAIATNEALQVAMPGKRPFILSRSTAPGSGRHTFHWTGDNFSNWPNLQYSITTIIEFGWFGIPFVGADICGFNNNCNDEELCLRWTQLGAFYPFMRNHNSITMVPQDPAIWSYQTQQYMKEVMLTRYQLLPHLYTLLYQSTLGNTVINPLFFNWPSDPNTRGIQDQFMWGKTLMIVPVITKGQTQRTAYFPSGTWYDFTKGCMSQSSLGQTRTLQVPLSTIGLFVYGGSIIPWQQPATTTYQSRQNAMGLTVALDGNHKASGDLFWDDGISQNGPYLLFHMNVSSEVLPRRSGILSIYRLQNSYRGADSLNWGSIYLYGIYSQPTSILVNGQPLQGSESYNTICNTLRLTRLSIPFATGTRSVQTIEWFY